MGEVIYLRLKSRVEKYSISWVTTRLSRETVSSKNEKGDKEGRTSKFFHYVDFTAGENQIPAVNIVTF